MGEVKITTEKLKKDDAVIPLTLINETLYISEKELCHLKIGLVEQQERFVLTDDPLPCEARNLRASKRANGYNEIKPVYCEHVRSELIEWEKEYYIPLHILSGKWLIEKEQDMWVYKGEQKNFYLTGLQITDQGIQNNEDYNLYLSCQHGFWEDGAFVYRQEDFLLEPHSFYYWQVHEKGIYVGTQVKIANGIVVSLVGQTDFKAETDFYKHYTEAERLKVLEKMFPQFKILAKMLYPVGKFKQGEEVLALFSEKNRCWWIQSKEDRENENDKKWQVPIGSIKVIGEEGAPLPVVKQQDIEDFVNLRKIESRSPYLIWTDVYRQRTYVLEKIKDKWKHQKTFICSTGKDINPTPTGFYEIEYIIPYFGMAKGYRCKYALVFFRDYMYHSILFDKTGTYIKSGQYELGSKASHGCIRLAEKDSYWLYTHIPIGTKVWIR